MIIFTPRRKGATSDFSLFFFLVDLIPWSSLLSPSNHPALSNLNDKQVQFIAIDCHLEARNTCNRCFEHVPSAAMNKSEINEIRPKTPPREETRLKRLNLSIRFIDSCWRWRPWCQSAMLSLKLGWPGWPFLESWKADDAKICQRYQKSYQLVGMWWCRESLKFKKKHQNGATMSYT